VPEYLVSLICRLLCVVSTVNFQHGAAVAALSADVGSVASLHAGVATVDITPSYPVRLNGFGGRTRESQGVRQSLFAKALAVGSSDDDTVIIVTVDTLGVPAEMTNRVTAALEARLGLARERLALCASHTHSGPMIRNCANTLFGQPIPDDHWSHILQYSDQLEAGLIEAAVRAWQNRRRPGSRGGSARLVSP